MTVVPHRVLLQVNCTATLPGSVLVNGTCECPSTTLKAYNNGNLSACVTACDGNFPVPGRAAVDTGAVLFCVNANGVCPEEGSFAYFAATQAGVAASLVQCTRPPSPLGCPATSAYTKPVQRSDTTTIGCLLDSFTTTECPASYGPGYGLAYRDTFAGNNGGIVRFCRPSSQTTCPPPGTFTTMAMNGTTLQACLSVSSCPAPYSVFAQANLPVATAPGVIAACLVRTPGFTCPSSGSLNFPFTLADGSTVNGCLGPQTAFTVCSNGYAPWDGATIFTATAAVGCLTRGSTSCPSGFTAFFDTTALGNNQLVQCRPALPAGVPCSSAPGGNIVGQLTYGTNLRDSAGNIVGCAPSGVECPRTYPVYVAQSFTDRTNPSDCLPSTTLTCPAINPPTGQFILRTFALYSGLATPMTMSALPTPTLAGCVAPVASATDCSNAAYGTGAFAAEVWGDNSGLPSQLVGCVDTTVATPCPASSPFVMQSDTGAASSILECRRNVVSCSTLVSGVNDVTTYSIRLTSSTGALQGCRQLAATRTAQSCAIATQTSTTVANGAPYVYPFPLLGAAATGSAVPQILECRTINSLDVPTSCAPFGSYSVPLFLGSTSIAVTGALVGCQTTAVRCPAELVRVGIRFEDTVNNVIPSIGFPLLSTNGVIEQCRRSSTTLSANGGNNGNPFSPELACGLPVSGANAGGGPATGQYNIPVLQPTGTSPNLMVTPTAVSGAPYTYGVFGLSEIFGCVRAGAPSTTCLRLTNTNGYPYAADAPTAGRTQFTNFIVALPGQPQASPPSGTLLACVSKENAGGTNFICQTADANNFFQRTVTATNAPSLGQTLGCTSTFNTASGVVSFTKQACDTWAAQNYGPLLPQNAAVTCATTP